jgi:hypothetical protein
MEQVVNANQEIKGFVQAALSSMGHQVKRLKIVKVEYQLPDDDQEIVSDLVDVHLAGNCTRGKKIQAHCKLNVLAEVGTINLRLAKAIQRFTVYNRSVHPISDQVELSA